MQNTRLNTLFDRATNQFEQFFRNPWRRLSLLTIALLFGIYLGTAIPTTAGQRAELDITTAGLLVLITESISRVIYGNTNRGPRSLGVDLINTTKIGLVYGMFVEAFKIAS
ncbi:MAG: DUF565 domain-containing protein [Leptolyngbyaceae cyanobacterium bins.59]|nr:DUF565 domain-containing protein [Leptolyngbyaceae cyanobacterium bins.59]